MASGKKGGGRARARRAIPELLHAPVFLGFGQETAESGCEEALVAGRVGNDVIAPVIENATVRVCESIGDITLELTGKRFKTVDTTVGIANRTGRRLHLCAMENTVALINRTAGFIANRVSRVM